MKICFLTDDPSPIGGGAQHIREISRLLRQKYHFAVDVITPLNMSPKFSPQNFWQRVLFAFWVLKFLITSDYDLYHSHAFSTNAFLPLMKLRGKKVGITVHGVGKNLISGGILNKMGIPKILGWLILNIWPYDFRLSASKLKNFITVGNGVDIDEFSKIKRRPHKVFTVLCISRRDPVKGVEILEKAIKNIPGVELNLVSGRQRTIADFAKADLYVLPSLSEGLPIVLLEAMAAKLPIVTTDVGDCREIVEKGQCGITVPTGDARALATAVKQMIKNKNRQILGQNGYDYVKKRYTWEKVTKLVYESYQNPTTG